MTLQNDDVQTLEPATAPALKPGIVPRAPLLTRADEENLGRARMEHEKNILRAILAGTATMRTVMEWRDAIANETMPIRDIIGIGIEHSELQDEYDDATEDGHGEKPKRFVTSIEQKIRPAVLTKFDNIKIARETGKISDLPDLIQSLRLKKEILDHLMQPFLQDRAALVFLDRSLLKAAMDHGIERQDFLRAYQGQHIDDDWTSAQSSISPIWAAFLREESATIEQLRHTIESISHKLELPIRQTRDVLDTVDKNQAGRQRIKDKMVRANMGLVFKIASHYFCPGMTQEDLQQEGSIGLMKAADRFQHDLGYKFSTYATPWIKQAICRGLDKRQATIPIPSEMRQDARKFHRFSDEVFAQSGRRPTPEQLAMHFGIATRTVIDTLAATNPTISLDTPLSDSGSSHTLGDMLTDGRDSVFHQIAQNSDQAFLRRLLECPHLKPQEKQAIEMRYLSGDDIRTIDECYGEMGVARERFRQHENNALKKLARFIRAIEAGAEMLPAAPITTPTPQP